MYENMSVYFMNENGTFNISYMKTWVYISYMKKWVYISYMKNFDISYMKLWVHISYFIFYFQ